VDQSGVTQGRQHNRNNRNNVLLTDSRERRVVGLIGPTEIERYERSASRWGEKERVKDVWAKPIFGVQKIVSFL
jgi:hypothetical protein